MLFRVNEIGLFQKEKKDIVKFNNGINFISGDPDTGKSSIGEIIDYCLGASKQTVPAGKKINETDIFSIYLTIDSHNIIIARNRYDGEEFEGKKYIFLKMVENDFSLKDKEITFFKNNNSSYFTKDDFLELEIIKYFSFFPPKTRLDGRAMVRPTIRNMPPFMLQIQTIITNDNHLFYQMDRRDKVSGIKRDFELFLGLIDSNIYNKINRKNEIIKELKKIKNSESFYENEIKREYFNLKSSYHRLFTHLNKNIDIESLDNSYFMDEGNLNSLQLEYKVDSDIGKKVEISKTKANKQSRIVEDLKIEFSNLQNQIKHIDTANSKLQTNTNIDYSKHCPICNAEVKQEFAIFETAKKKTF